MANLPVPVPATVSPSGFITSSLWNANVRDPLTYSLNVPVFVGTQTITQSAANGWTACALDSEQVDTYGGHSTTSNTSRYVAPVAGWYTVAGVAVFVGNGTGIRAARIQINGSYVVGTAQFLAPSSTGSFTGVMTATRAVQLAAGDYVELGLGQTSGGALSTGVASDLASALYVAWSHT